MKSVVKEVVRTSVRYVLHPDICKEAPEVNWGTFPLRPIQQRCWRLKIQMRLMWYCLSWEPLLTENEIWKSINTFSVRWVCVHPLQTISIRQNTWMDWWWVRGVFENDKKFHGSLSSVFAQYQPCRLYCCKWFLLEYLLKSVNDVGSVKVLNANIYDSKLKHFKDFHCLTSKRWNTAVDGTVDEWNDKDRVSKNTHSLLILKCNNIRVISAMSDG